MPLLAIRGIQKGHHQELYMFFFPTNVREQTLSYRKKEEKFKAIKVEYVIVKRMCERNINIRDTMNLICIYSGQLQPILRVL